MKIIKTIIVICLLNQPIKISAPDKWIDLTKTVIALASGIVIGVKVINQKTATDLAKNQLELKKKDDINMVAYCARGAAGLLTFIGVRLILEV